MPALGGVVISTKKMNRVLKIDLPNLAILAQTGIANLAISRAVADYGLHFGPDPSSQSVSTLGGNIAENSGGPHTLKYGVTTQHILALTLVTPDGEVVEINGADVPGYDLASLIIGAEGMAGLVTEAWVRLTPLPEAKETALVFFGQIRDCTNSVASIIKSGVVPAAVEMMDRNVLQAVSDAFGLQFHPESAASLLVECDGKPEVAKTELDQVVELCRQNNALDVTIAKSEAERELLWRARKKGIGALGRIAPTVVTHDGVIPPSKLPDVLDEVYRIAERHGLGVANMFHAGDGNLHPIFTFDARDKSKIDSVMEAGEEVIAACLAVGGSVSGEHGIGVEKTNLLAQMFDPVSLEFQSGIKSIFGEQEMNPCKVIPSTKGCIEHKARWKGAAW